MSFRKMLMPRKKSNTLFTGLQKQRAKTSYVTKPTAVNTRPRLHFLTLLIISSSPFKGAPCSAIQGVGDSYSQGHLNMEVRTNSLVLAQPKLL